MFCNNELYKKDIAKVVAYDIDWRQLQGKSVLITGATGLIGTFLIDVIMYRNKLFNDNIIVYAVGRNKEKAQARFSEYIDTRWFVFIQQNIQGSFQIDNAIDYIIHGASNTHPVAYATDPINTLLLSINGTKNILNFAVRNSVIKTLFLSSVEVYGENRGDVERFTEEYCGYLDCNTLRAGYPEGKRAAEALCQAYKAEKDVDIVIARCCRVYGPTMGNDDSKVIAQFLRCARDSKDIVLKSKGDQRYSYCYVADVCLALLVLLVKGKNGEAYNIADSSVEITLSQIAKILSIYTQKKVIFDVPQTIEVAGYSKATKALIDSTKLQGIGWNSCYTLKDGLIRTVEILRSI